MRHTRRLLLALVAVFAARALPALETPAFSPVTTRFLATGGYHAAYHAGIFSLFSNPAALSRVLYKGIFHIDAGAAGGAASYGAFFNALSGKDPSGEALKSAVTHNVGHPPPLLYLNGPFAAGYAAKGSGLGFFNRLFCGAELRKTDDGRREWRINMNADLLGAWGRSFGLVDSFAHKLEAGVALKTFVRYVNNIARYSVDADGAAVSEGVAGGVIVPGAGANIGMLYTFHDTFSFGVHCDDLPAAYLFVYTASRDAGDPVFALAAPALNAGAAFKIMQNGAAQLVLALDARDILRHAGILDAARRHALLVFSLGAELTLGSRFTVRAGLADLLPSAGLGVVLGGVSLDAAFYGKEYGARPGEASAYAFGLSLGFR